MVEVLFPQRFHDFGVTRKDFELLRPKEEVKEKKNKEKECLFFNRLKNYLQILDMDLSQESLKEFGLKLKIL